MTHTDAVRVEEWERLWLDSRIGDSGLPWSMPTRKRPAILPLLVRQGERTRTLRVPASSVHRAAESAIPRSRQSLLPTHLGTAAVPRDSLRGYSGAAERSGLQKLVPYNRSPSILPIGDIYARDMGHTHGYVTVVSAVRDHTDGRVRHLLAFR